MTALRRHMRFQAIWILVVSTLLMSNPWGSFGWVELAAVFAPLAMLLDRRIVRETALALGVPALTLIWFADPAGSSILSLVIAWLVLGAGIVLAARTIRGQQELEAVAGQVAFAPPDDETLERFQSALERELGRARRHERPFALLSVAAHPNSLEADAAGPHRSELLRSLAENRARLELRDFLQAELHVYCDVATDGPRVLALVPEIEPDTLAVLLQRLEKAADGLFDFDVQMGVACFPRDAVCADELISAADRNRMTSQLRSLSEHVLDLASDESERRTPDVQG